MFDDTEVGEENKIYFGSCWYMVDWIWINQQSEILDSRVGINIQHQNSSGSQYY